MDTTFDYPLISLTQGCLFKSITVFFYYGVSNKANQGLNKTDVSAIFLTAKQNVKAGGTINATNPDMLYVQKGRIETGISWKLCQKVIFCCDPKKYFPFLRPEKTKSLVDLFSFW